MDLFKVVLGAMVPRSKIISIRIRTDAHIELKCRKIRRTCRMSISFKTSNIPNKLSHPKSLKIQHYRL